MNILALIKNPLIMAGGVTVLLAVSVNFIIDIIRVLFDKTKHIGRLKKETKEERNVKYRLLIILLSAILVMVNSHFGLPITGNYFTDALIVSILSLITYHIGYKKLRSMVEKRIKNLIKGKK